MPSTASHSKLSAPLGMVSSTRMCTSSSTADGATASTAAPPALNLGSWEMTMETKYGPGRHRFGRNIYKDLCDEFRGEAFTRPPPPLEGWSAHHKPGTKIVTFSREAVNGIRAVAVTELKFENPPQADEAVTFADCFITELLMERNGAVMHTDMYLIDKGVELKNFRMYTAEDLLPAGMTMDAASLEARWQRRNNLYDGPCILHLEEDLKCHLRDLTEEVDIDEDFVVWVGDWVHYLEHTEYVRWSLALQDHVLSLESIESEAELLTPYEAEVSSQSSEEWRRDTDKY